MEELALHILDLIQNSLAAGARRLELTLVEDTVEGTLALQLTDDGKGMDESTRMRVFDPFFTSRKTRRVGLGLPLFRATAESTGGWVKLDSWPGQGTRVSALLYSGHVDCPPLGDMAVTVALNVAANPEVDFVYTHTVDDCRLEFHTADIRRQLGDVPLSDPEVYRWILGFLHEELRKLHGGATENEIPRRSGTGQAGSTGTDPASG